MQQHLALPCVVDEELCHLAKRPTFLPEIDNNTHATLLRCSYAFLDSVDEVWTAGAYVGSENIRPVEGLKPSPRRTSNKDRHLSAPVAFVVNTDSTFFRRVSAILHRAEDVDCLTADWWQKDVDVGACNKLREHPAGLLEHAPSKRCLGDAKALCHS